MVSSSDKLDLTSLQSYSPSWPHTLRLTLAIAVQYASARCVARAREIHLLIDPIASKEASDASMSALEKAAAERRYGQEEDDDKDLVERDEEGRETGKLEGWARKRRLRKEKEMVDAWIEYGDKFVMATCQHLGINRDTLPPGPLSLEDVLCASRGRIDDDSPNREPAAMAQFEMGNSHLSKSHEGTGTMAKKVKEAEKQEGEEKEKEERAGEALEKEGPRFESDDRRGGDQVVEDHMEVQGEEKSKQSKVEHEQKEEHVKRSGGALEEEGARGREIEVVHELLLVALGLGQYRAEDGATTLFEQDALFGDTTVQVAPEEASSTTESERGPTSDTVAGTSSAPPPLPPRTSTERSTESSHSQEIVSESNAWGVFKTGAASSWKNITSTSKGVKDGISSSFAAPTAGSREQPAKEKRKKGEGPTKPNEPCHYDARARAIIFVAATAMDVQGMDAWMAEKVVAQTIYFIMSEGRDASKKQGQADPLVDLAKQQEEGSDTNARKSWMNRATGTAVAREKGKANWGKWAATGAGFAIGGAIIGLTGGLAAPLIAPALVGLTGVSFLATTGGIIMMGTLLGLGGGGLAGYRVQRRLRGIDYFEFQELPSAAQEAGMTIPSLTATICCSGLLLQKHDQMSAWQQIFRSSFDARDVFAIRCEEEMMKLAGEGLRSYARDTALYSGGQRVGTEVLKHTAFAGLAAITLPMTIYSAASASLDGRFVQAKTRCYKAGLILADVLREQVQGHRPVILVATSLGCVTVMTALAELAKSPDDYAHLVDSVFLIGAPISPSPGTLRRARSVVTRRFVNAYSSKDMVCAIAAWLGSGISLEELQKGQMPRICGSRAILDVPGVENVDVGDIVKSHFDLNEPQVLESVVARCRLIDA